MQLLIKIATILIFSHLAQAHNEESRVSLEPNSLTTSDSKTTYTFQIVDTKSEKLIAESDLNISHEKKLHMIAYDPSLNEFQHVHPIYANNMWSVELNFKAQGDYWIWAQGQLTADDYDFSASNRLKVTSGVAALPSPATLTDVRKFNDGSSVVELSKQTLKAKKMTMLNITMSRNDGSKVNVTPYLGAFAHVIVVPEDADSIIHAHPMDGAKPNTGMIHIEFPQAGFYRVWVQFIDDGVLKLVPLSVKVN